MYGLSAYRGPSQLKESRYETSDYPSITNRRLRRLTTTEASAVIYCAAGVYRAGCVARPVVVAPRAVVVAPVLSLSLLYAGGFTEDPTNSRDYDVKPMSLHGAKRTCWADLTMSVDGGRTEVGGARSNRSD
jgi:hypothetical protein